MSDLKNRLHTLGVTIPEILMPSSSIRLDAWSVIACDQYTQDHSYWKQVEQTSKNTASIYSIIYPEIYLENPDRDERITSIRQSMKAYLEDGILTEGKKGCVYIERSTPFHPKRQGLVLAVDLERYDWNPAARPLIRATEGTVKERLPPRMVIRRDAPLETPHIILLIDDKDNELLQGLEQRAKNKKELYTTNLMMDAGSIQGWLLDQESEWQFIADQLEKLANRASAAYGQNSDEDPFLFAVGDGNHSLATAKAVWDEYKKLHSDDAGIMEHPARWALVEVENIYDPGIDFEPIHRILFNTGIDELESVLKDLPGYSRESVSDTSTLVSLVEEACEGETRYGLVSREGCFLVRSSNTGISTELLQPLLDSLVEGNTGRSIDYLHGSDETIRVALENAQDSDRKPRTGILLPPIGKEDLFATVGRSGPLPRKSFSMGEAVEKRFYMECRKLFPLAGAES